MKEIVLELESASSNAHSASDKSAIKQRIEGVVIGVLVDLTEPSSPVVAFPGNTQLTGVPARTTVILTSDDIGLQVALLFENGDPKHPVVIGRIQQLEDTKTQAEPKDTLIAETDGDRLELSAEREIVLRCGKASITLTRAGKVLIRGAYVLSRSSGANRIKGGSVQIN